MAPEAALEKQISHYCQMTGEERLAVGLDLQGRSCAVAREEIRHQHLEADKEEVERQLRHRLALTREL